MKLISLPDNKKTHEHLTIGKDYEVKEFSTNGYRMTMNNNEEIIILKERFE